MEDSTISFEAPGTIITSTPEKTPIASRMGNIPSNEPFRMDITFEELFVVRDGVISFRNDYTYSYVKRFRGVFPCDVHFINKNINRKQTQANIYSYCPSGKQHVVTSPQVQPKKKRGECLQFRTIIEIDKYNLSIVSAVVTPSGVFNHGTATNPIYRPRQIRGDERRDVMSGSLRYLKPKAYRNKALINAYKENPEKFELAVFQGVPTQVQAAQMRCEVKKKDDLHENDMVDLLLRQLKEFQKSDDKQFLRGLNFPCSMFSKEANHIILDYFKKGEDVVVHFDATGSLVRAPYPASKRVFLYVGAVSVPTGRGPYTLPLMQFISNEHTTFAIKRMFEDYKYSNNNILYFNRVVTDHSYASIHAVLKGFLDISLMEYIVHCYDYLTQPKAAQFKHGVTLHLCCAHFTKRLTVHGKKYATGKPALAALCANLIIYALGERSRDLTAAKSMFRNIVIILSSEYHHTGIDDAFASIDDFEQTRDGEIILEHSVLAVADAECGPHVSEDSTDILKNSPFYRDFLEIRQDVESDLPRAGFANVHYCPGFLNYVMERYIPILPLWGGMMLPQSRNHLYSNALVESYFGMLKNNKFRGERNLKVGRFVKEMEAQYCAHLLDLKYRLPVLQTKAPSKRPMVDDRRNTRRDKKVKKNNKVDNNPDSNDVTEIRPEFVKESWQQKRLPSNKNNILAKGHFARLYKRNTKQLLPANKASAPPKLTFVTHPHNSLVKDPDFYNKAYESLLRNDEGVPQHRMGYIENHCIYMSSFYKISSYGDGWLDDGSIDPYLIYKFKNRKSTHDIRYVSIFEYYSAVVHEGPISRQGKGKVPQNKFINRYDSELVIVPYNYENMHWVLLLMNRHKRQFSVIDSQKSARATVIMFDLFKDKCVPLDERDHWSIKEYDSEQQTDCKSCGLFVILNACALLENERPRSLLNPALYRKELMEDMLSMMQPGNAVCPFCTSPDASPVTESYYYSCTFCATWIRSSNKKRPRVTECPQKCMYEFKDSSEEWFQCDCCTRWIHYACDTRELPDPQTLGTTGSRYTCFICDIHERTNTFPRPDQ